jgi:predicted DNA binding CopG/RHH family protein
MSNDNISISQTKNRGFEKRSRATTLRLSLRDEEVLTVAASAEQLDVVDFISQLLRKFVDTDPVKHRMFKIKALAASCGMTPEEYVQAVLQKRFSKIDYDFDQVSAIDRVLINPDRIKDV